MEQMKKAVLNKQTAANILKKLGETILNCDDACSNWRNNLATVELMALVFWYSSIYVTTDVVLVSE